MEAIRKAAAGKGCRLLAVEGAGAGRFSVVRLVLEREGGESVTVDDCEAVSREASAVLDASDEIPHRYTLEVSSAGLDRKLYCLEDAVRFIGRRVKVQTVTPVRPEPLNADETKGVAGPARNFSGILRSVDDDLLVVVDEGNRKIYNVRFGDIRVARLDFFWPDRGN